MKKIVLRNGLLINKDKRFYGDLLIENERIKKIGPNIHVDGNYEEINIEGKILIPGCIDDQVHFREPGLTHKASIFSESRACVAGGITSFMEMPNTVPNTLTQTLLQEKYDIASSSSLANYSFYMGASNDNYDEVMKTDMQKVCGVKIFMGSSTGNMLVDRADTLEKLFSSVPLLIATHCEDEETIKKNMALFEAKYGSGIRPEMHPLIRSEEACFLSSSMAVALARKNNTRLHILHISTEKETHLFDSLLPLEQKKITAEACVHHLYFSDEDYKKKGDFIKWNPAVKTKKDQLGILEALTSNRIDVIATDHAPHTVEEKTKDYLHCPSGGPLVQDALLAMIDVCIKHGLPLEFLVRKMCHAPAQLFRIKDRGFLNEGFFADLVVLNPSETHTVKKNNLLYKCGWSPFLNTTFSHSVEATFVNGIQVWDGKKQAIIHETNGKRLQFAYT